MWRVIVAISLIPAFGTLYQRLTLPESTRYEKASGKGDNELTKNEQDQKSGEYVKEELGTPDPEGCIHKSSLFPIY